MIDHVSIAVRDLATSAAAYERFLTPLGMRRVVESAGSVGFGKTYPELWLNARPAGGGGGEGGGGVEEAKSYPELWLSARPAGPRMPADTGHHVCLRAPDEA